MAVTIIGVYDDFSQGYSAKNELLSSGFSRGQVELNPDHDVSKTTDTSAPPADDVSLRAGVGNIFTSLLGVGNNRSTHSNVYAEAVRRGGYVLTVDADDDAQRAHAEEIMSRFAPVDIEKRSAEWMQYGWRGHDPSVPTGAGKVRIFGGGKPSGRE